MSRDCSDVRPRSGSRLNLVLALASNRSSSRFLHFARSFRVVTPFSWLRKEVRDSSWSVVTGSSGETPSASRITLSITGSSKATGSAMAHAPSRMQSASSRQRDARRILMAFPLLIRFVNPAAPFQILPVLTIIRRRSDEFGCMRNQKNGHFFEEFDTCEALFRRGCRFVRAGRTWSGACARGGVRGGSRALRRAMRRG